MRASAPEALLEIQLRAAGLSAGAEREFRFAPPRRWRFDVAFPLRRIAVEIEGGIWTGGRHTRGSGFQADMQKYNEAALLGWRVLRVSSDDVRSGSALALIERALRTQDDAADSGAR